MLLITLVLLPGCSLELSGSALLPKDGCAKQGKQNQRTGTAELVTDHACPWYNYFVLAPHCNALEILIDFMCNCLSVMLGDAGVALTSCKCLINSTIWGCHSARGILWTLNLAHFTRFKEINIQRLLHVKVCNTTGYFYELVLLFGAWKARKTKQNNNNN